MPVRPPSPFVSTVLGLAISASAVSVGAAEPPTAEEIRATVDEDRLRGDLRALTGHDPIPDGEGGELVARTRNIHHPHHRLAGAWVEQRLAETPGLTVDREFFDAAGEIDLFNLVAELPGADPQLAPLIVAAHYDSIASATDGWDPATDIAPGADDDASGVAAVLEIARVLAAQPGLRRTVRFVAFSAEEYGLLGSSEYVERLQDGEEDVELMLQLDPIGYDPGGSSLLWVTYDDRWPEPADDLASVGEELGSRLDVSTIDADLIGGDQRSDHAPFWAAGIPALHLASFPQPPTYHTIADDLDVVDPAFHFEVTALVAAFIAREAEVLPIEDENGGCAGCESSLLGRAGPTWRTLFATLGVGTALAVRRRRRR